MTKIRLIPLACLVLTASIATFVSGCNPQDSVTPGTAEAATATTAGMEIDDTVITTKVKSALLTDPDTEGYEIKVETRKGEVLLSGFVDSASQVARAMAIADSVEGVKSVGNGMTLKDGKTSLGNKVDDAVITTKVKSALLSDVSVKSFDIAVATRKGEVQLSGFVENKAQLDRAVEIASAVEGVASVSVRVSFKK